MEIILFIIVLLLSALVLAFAAWRSGRCVLRRYQMAAYNELDFLVLIGDGLRLGQSAQEQDGGAVIITARCSLFKQDVRKDLRLFKEYAVRVYDNFNIWAFMGFGARVTVSFYAPNGRYRIGMPIRR